MRFGKIFAVALCALALQACDNRNMPDVRQAAQSNVVSTGRFTMKVVDEFHDRNAYNNSRSIAIITDTKTGKQYIGVEGMGVTDLQSERAQDDDDADAAASAASVAAMTAVN